MLYLLTAFFLTVLFLPFVRNYALKIGFVDVPEGRKTHTEAVPQIGGLVVIPVFVAVSWLAGFNFSGHLFFLAALFIVWVLGALDDKYHVSALTKFGIHMLAAIMLVMGNHTIIHYLGDLFGFGVIWTEPLAIVFSVMCVVFIINAINMIDGLDGLCGGIVMIMLMALGASALLLGGHELLVPVFVMIGALGGFMIYNYRYVYRRRACLFMGDSGSTALGLTISWIVIEMSQNTATMQPGLLEPELIAWVLALPAFDALSLFAYRLTRGRSPFSADRRHLHYLICDRGISVTRSVNYVHLMTLIYCAIGFIAFGIFSLAPYILMPFWIALFSIHFAMIFGMFDKTAFTQKS